MKHLFLLATVTMIAVIVAVFIAAVVRETNSFIKIMQPITPNYNWENGNKQIKINEENLSQSCILCQLLRTNTLASGSKCIQHFFYFYHYLFYICRVDVIYLICLVLTTTLDILWSNPFNPLEIYGNRKYFVAHQKFLKKFYGPSIYA